MTLINGVEVERRSYMRPLLRYAGTPSQRHPAPHRLTLLAHFTPDTLPHCRSAENEGARPLYSLSSHT